jgi:hypothetical protein
MKRAFLHIGLEKTGTTSLQAFLKANESLLNENGFSYLCDDSKPYVEGDGHFPIAACFLPQCPDFVSPAKYRPASEVLHSLKSDVELSPYDVILSCEHFSSRLRDASALISLRESLSSRKVTVMVYLRRQDDMALATYSTAVISGRREPFSVEAVARPTNRRYNYLKVSKLWASVFGWDHLVLLPYDRARLQGGDVRSDFLGRLGIPKDRFRFGENANVSLQSSQIELLREVNQHLDAFGAGDRRSYDVSQHARRIVLEHLPSSEQPGSVLTTADRQRILEAFSQSNAALADKANDAQFLSEWASPSSVQLDHEPGFVSASAESLAELVARLAKAIADALVQRETLVGEMQSNALRRDDRIRVLEQVLAQRETLVGEMQSNALRRDNRIREVETVLAQREAQAGELARALAQRDDRLRDLELEHAKSIRRIAELEQTAAELRSVLAVERNLSRDASALKDQLLYRLNDRQTSAAGQLARPLYAAGRRLPRLVQGVAAVPKFAWSGLTLRLPERLRLRRLAAALLASGQFDLDWYLRQNPDVVLGGQNPVMHWLAVGWREGRAPNRHFDMRAFVETLADVDAKGLEALVERLQREAANDNARPPRINSITDSTVEQDCLRPQGPQ